MDIKEVQQPNSDGHYKQHQERKMLNFVHQHLLSRMETIQCGHEQPLAEVGASVPMQLSDFGTNV